MTTDATKTTAGSSPVERPVRLGFFAPLVKACPFCGKRDTLKLTTMQELIEEGEDDPEPWLHSDSWAVMCDASSPGGPGGCGASGGFFPSDHAAVAAWNRRA